MKRSGKVYWVLYALLLIQTINLFTARLETGTQGSLDGFITTVILGIPVSLVILILTTNLNDPGKSAKIVAGLFLAINSVMLPDCAISVTKIAVREGSLNGMLTGIMEAQAKLDYYGLLLSLAVLIMTLLNIGIATSIMIHRKKVKRNE